MQNNVGNIDRVIRIVLAIVLGLVATMSSAALLQGLLFLAAAIALITGLVSFCPLYKILGLSTCPKS